MKKSREGKRLLSVALSVLLAVSSLPTAAFAGGHNTQEFCEHHQEHTSDCGYMEEQPCAHSHTEECYTDELVCGLIEDEDVIVATGSDWEDNQDGDGHSHSEECYGLDCAHERGEHEEDGGTCGYTEAQPCTYSCELCKKPDKKPEAGTEQTVCTLTEDCTLADGHEGGCVTEDIPQLPLDGLLAKTIASWTFVDDDGLTEGELALPGVDAGNQIDFDKVASMLPTQIQAELDGEEDPAMVDITGWDCPEYIQDAGGNWPVSGKFPFAAELEPGYTCKPLPTVTVSLGGGQTLELIEGEGYSFNTATGELVITSSAGTTAWREDTGIGAKIDFDNPNKNVTSVIIQKTVTQIGDYAFFHCESLKTAELPDTITSIGKRAFSRSGLEGMLDLSFMEKLVSIGESAFSNCPITSAALPDSLSALGRMSFYGCSDLVSIRMPQNDVFTSFGNFQFFGCTSLTAIDLSGCMGLTSIPTWSFSGCTALKEVVFPSALKSIDTAAFGDCTSLNKLTFLGDTAPAVKADTFSEVPQTGTLDYPADADYTAVKNALPQGWTQSKDQPQTIEKSTYSTSTPLVGETIVSTDGAYTSNGGGAERSHLYQWKRADNADRTGNVKDISAGKDYITTPEDFGKYIWLETTPVGDGSMEGAPVQADVLRVGVKLAVKVNGGSGGTNFTVNGTDATDGVVVYGKASVSFTKKQVTDVVSWSAVPNEGNFSEINNAATDYTPATAPSVGNITLAANLTGFGSTTVGAFQITGDASGYTFNDPELVIHNGATLIIQNTDTGTSTKQRIKVASGVTNVNITLAGVNINVEDQRGICAFLVEAGGNANITLVGTNTLRSGNGRAGLEIPENASVTILGDGSITANGFYGAGIGGGENGNSGTIEISGHVNVKAIGNSGGAGIGGGENGSGGNIKISGGTVNAIGHYGAGIGGGLYGSGGKVEISGKGTMVTVWGSAYSNAYKCYDVGSGSEHNSGGSLSVTDGATLEMKNNGTNASTRYQNCIIIDKNGQSTEYNRDGKAITALMLEVTPQSPQTYPVKVELTATLSGLAGNMSGKMIKFSGDGGITFSASVPTGDDGKAAYSIENLPAGSYTFKASFEGDQENVEASANPVTYQVDIAEQEEIIIQGLDNDLIYGDGDIGLSVSGGSVREGKVSYVSSNPDVASVEGEDQLTIHKAGTFTITATKKGNDNYKEQSVTSRLVTVNPATPEISLDFTGGADINTPVELTVTVSERENGKTPAGTVTFYDGSTIMAENLLLDEFGEAAFSVNNPAGGSHTYRAVYSGETGYYNGGSAECTVEVGLADQTGFVISDPGVRTYGEKAFTLAAVGGQSNGEVSFSVPADNGILTVKPDGEVNILGAGKVTVTAVKAADGSYHQATAMLEITVNPRDISHVTGSVTGSHVYTGSQIRPAFTVEDGDIVITADDYVDSYGANVNAGSGAGSITLTGQRNYTGTKTVQFDIEKRSLATAVITLESDSYPYTGGGVKPVITSVVVDGITVPAEAYDVEYTNHTAVGTAAVTIIAKADSNFSGTAGTTFTITRPNRSTGGGSGSSGTSSTNPDTLHGTWIQTDTGIWMFRQTNGAPVMSRWGLIDGLWYYFDSEGRMLTGWQFLGGQWYYLCTKEDLPAKPGMKEGAMASGWHFDLLLQKWYYLDASGAMAADRVIDGWYVDTNGVWDGKENK